MMNITQLLIGNSQNTSIMTVDGGVSERSTNNKFMNGLKQPTTPLATRMSHSVNGGLLGDSLAAP